MGKEKVMQIYWSVMSGLLLLPWSLILAPALTLGYRRLTSGPERRDRRMQPVGFAYDTTTSSWKRMKGDFLASSRACCREALACSVLAFGRIAWKNLT